MSLVTGVPTSLLLIYLSCSDIYITFIMHYRAEPHGQIALRIVL